MDSADGEGELQPEWLLYVGKHRSKDGFCEGSSVCLRVLEREHIPEDVVAAQNCDVLRRMSDAMPSCVRGTPTLVRASDASDVHAGSDAVATLLHIGSTLHEKKRSSSSSLTKQGRETMLPDPPASSGHRHAHSRSRLMNPAQMDPSHASSVAATSAVGVAAAAPPQPSSLPPPDDDVFGALVGDPVDSDPEQDRKITQSDVQSFMDSRKASMLPPPPA